MDAVRSCVSEDASTCLDSWEHTAYDDGSWRSARLHCSGSLSRGKTRPHASEAPRGAGSLCATAEADDSRGDGDVCLLQASPAATSADPLGSWASPQPTGLPWEPAHPWSSPPPAILRKESAACRAGKDWRIVLITHSKYLCARIHCDLDCNAGRSSSHDAAKGCDSQGVIQHDEGECRWCRWGWTLLAPGRERMRDPCGRICEKGPVELFF